MKKLALVLAIVMVVFAFAACGAKKCHSCGSTEKVEKVGDNYYCESCIMNGNMELSDAAKYLQDALGGLDLGELGF